MVAIAASICLCFCAGVAVPCQAAATTSSPAAVAKAKKPKLTAKQRARMRRTLARQLKRNPGLVLNRSFMKKAAFVELHIPMTVRLNGPNDIGGGDPDDDLLEITWDDSVFAWPLAPVGVMAATQTVPIAGLFSLESIFKGGDTTGYGEPGALEAIFGGGISMTADPFKISEFATACPDGPQLATGPVAITKSEPRYGVTNPFSKELRGTLSLRMTFLSNEAATCGATPAPTTTVDNSGAPPMPLRFDGEFAVSPSVTADGKLRFAKITIDDSVDPQSSTFAFVRACTAPPGCTPKSFPARIKLKKMTADVLLGDAFP